MTADMRGPVGHDARIVLFRSAHGVHEFATADRDFGRLGMIKVSTPLKSLPYGG